jgi:predicted membrane-bound spermidine synthase
MDIKRIKLKYQQYFGVPFSSIRFILSVLFFFSGAAALIYQVAWERMLFTLFGVGLESVTIVVSVFMFGLGAGGLLGGYIADLFPKKLLGCYILTEMAVALFGICSPAVIAWVGNSLLGSSEWIIAAGSFVVLVIPTFLMGATFPILVTLLNHSELHIGRSVGSLYFANTLGAAAGAYMAGFVLLYSMGLKGEIQCAVLLNLSIAISAFVLFRGED